MSKSKKQLSIEIKYLREGMRTLQEHYIELDKDVRLLFSIVNCGITTNGHTFKLKRIYNDGMRFTFKCRCGHERTKIIATLTKEEKIALQKLGYDF